MAEYTQFDNGVVIHGDCLEVMETIPEKSIDMILCDLPYGTTACKWDVIIPFDKLWNCYKNIIKDNRAVCLFGQEPFSSSLRFSNIEWFKYDWYWNKKHNSGYVNAKLKPMSTIELISVFSNGKTSNGNPNNMLYNPQGLIPYNKVTKRGNKADKENSFYRPSNASNENLQEFTNYPRNLIEFSYQTKSIHPTQKPVDLCEYLIKTYTNENQWVLDNCSGSGTTAIACINTNRKFICIEKDDKYYQVSVERIQNYLNSINR